MLDDLFNVGSWLVILTVAILALYFAFNGYVGFDEGYNLQIPASLVSQGRYTTNYNGGTPFDPHITTGPTVLLPVAAVFAMTRTVSVENGRLVMVVYLVGTMLAAWALMRKLYGAIGGFLVVVILASMPDLANLGVAVLGEVPGVFFCLVGLLWLRSKKPFLAGLFIGLAMLTKLVFAMAGGALLLVYFFEVLKNWRSGRWQAIRSGLLGLSGFVLPNVGWEIFKFASLGRQAYVRELKVLFNLLSNSAGLQVTSTSATLTARVDVFKSPFGELSGWLVLALLLAATVLAALRGLNDKNIQQNDSQRSLHLFFFIFSAGFLGWWLLSANPGWWRYLLPGMMLMAVPLVGLIGGVSNFCQKQLRRIQDEGSLFSWAAATVSGFLSVGLLLALILIPFYDQISRVQQQVISYTQLKSVQIKAAQRVTELVKNRGEFGGWGWWQAPEISFLSGQAFIDLDQEAVRSTADRDLQEGKKVYIIVAPAQVSIVPEAWQSEKKYAGDLIYDAGGFQIYTYISIN